MSSTKLGQESRGEDKRGGERRGDQRREVVLAFSSIATTMLKVRSPRCNNEY